MAGKQNAERIADMADQGKDVSAHFTNRFTVGETWRRDPATA